MFRRKGKPDQDEPTDSELLADDAPQEADAEPATAPAAAPARPQGPWDLDDVPDDELERVDLGGLRLPVPDQTEVRVDVSPEGQVVAATMVQGVSAMQVSAFAAPRSAGIWTEVREEIATALREGGGRADTAPGPWGPELHAHVPTETGELAPARFVGIDGPRWFLRALLTGPAATSEQAAEPLLAALRQVVVVRGGEAMAVRDMLPLVLPAAVAEQAASAQRQAAGAAGTEDAAQADAPELTMPERGPEITEIR